MNIKTTCKEITAVTRTKTLTTNIGGEENFRNVRRQRSGCYQLIRVLCVAFCLGNLWCIVRLQSSALCQQTVPAKSLMESLFGPSQSCTSNAIPTAPNTTNTAMVSMSSTGNGRALLTERGNQTVGLHSGVVVGDKSEEEPSKSVENSHHHNDNKHTHRNHQELPRNPKRLFLGIFTAHENVHERQLNHMIRNTYLNFYTDLLPHIQRNGENEDPTRVPQVCKWEIFMNSIQDSYKSTSTIEEATQMNKERKDCQIVYTFITNASNQRIEAKAKDPFYTSNKYTVDPSTVDDDVRHVGDMLFLNQEYQTRTYPKSIYDNPRVMFGKYERIRPCLSKVLTLYDYLWHILSNDDSSSSSLSSSFPPMEEIFDYIAYSDSRVMLYPTEIFPMTNDKDGFWYKDQKDASTTASTNGTPTTTSTTDTSDAPFYFIGGSESRINGNQSKRADGETSIRQAADLTSLPRLNGKTKFDRFVILSSPLFRHFMENIVKNPTTVFDRTLPGVWIPNQLNSRHLSATSRFDSTNHSKDSINDSKLVRQSRQTTGIDETNTRKQPSMVPETISTKSFTTGAKLMETNYDYELLNKFIRTWEKYKDSLLEYKSFSLEELLYTKQHFLQPTSLPKLSNDGRISREIQNDRQSTASASNYLLSKHVNSTTFNGPRILMGIFTTNDYQEARRRDLIRKSYLNYYNVANGEDNNRNRICSLQMFTSDGFVREQCQLVYTFVLGGRGLYDENGMSSTTTNATTNLVDIYNRLEDEKRYDELPPLTVEPYPLIQKTENTNPVVKAMEPDDIVFLNIHENMNDGKSPTWIMYANRIKVIEYDEDGTRNEIPFLFDYIAKIDSDTVLYPEIFLDEVFSPLPSFPHNARYYGGDVPVVGKQLGLASLGPYFFQGSFYIMSWDLAEYVTSPRCIRDPWDAKKEDRSMGNWIRTYPLPIRTFSFFMASVHPVKWISEYRSTWNKHVQKKHPENVVAKPTKK